jgi:membrane-bound metal-dependent hydrolase YbcI (DUF457 family)
MNLQQFLVHEIIHFIALIPAALLIWYKTKSVKSLIVLFAAGILIDIDHLIDYFAYYGMQINALDFISADYFKYSGLAIVPFHGWEWVIITLLLAYKRGWKSVFTPIALGLLTHLIVDSINIHSFLFYSFLYRMSRGFMVE